MIVAIYARKSTEQRGDDNAKSVVRQIADARAFAKLRGLPAIEDRHVYADDAVSGADVKNLRARARLIADVEAGRINVIIMADLSRYSRRDPAEVVLELKRLDRRAKIYFYETGEQYRSGDFGDAVSNFVRAGSNNDYRQKIRTKTIAAMKHKAALGHVVTRPCFGYRNVPVFNGTDVHGQPIRSHTTREIDPDQARIVVSIYETFAAGRGLKFIANDLNTRGVPTPTPKTGRIAGWSTSSVRAILKNPIYQGIARWNRFRQKDDDGNAILEVNPESEHVQCGNEAWRIVSPALVEAVERRFANTHGFGTSSRGAASRSSYLLTGNVRCPVCGGSFIGSKVAQRKGATTRPTYVYECSTFRHRGKAICSNNLRAPADILEPAVLRLIADALKPEFVDNLLRLTEPADNARGRLDAERDDLVSKIEKLRAALQHAIETGLDFDDLAPMLAQRKRELQAVERQIAALPATQNRAELRAVLEKRTSDWQTRLLSEHRHETRAALDQLLTGRAIILFSGGTADEGPILFFDDDQRGKEGIEPEDCLQFEVTIDPARLLLSMVAGAGFEPATFGL
jgi:site-specific DNA recombinase